MSRLSRRYQRYHFLLISHQWSVAISTIHIEAGFAICDSDIQSVETLPGTNRWWPLDEPFRPILRQALLLTYSLGRRGVISSRWTTVRETQVRLTVPHQHNLRICVPNTLKYPLLSIVTLVADLQVLVGARRPGRLQTQAAFNTTPNHPAAII